MCYIKFYKYFLSLSKLMSIYSTREVVTKHLLREKRDKKISYEELAGKIGKNKVWLAAALNGNATMDEKEARTICSALGIGEEYIEDYIKNLTQPPYRHPPEGFKGVCADPTIYRMYEVINVYGEALKDLIHEEFGDGIMSAIGLQVNFEKKKKEDGDHVVITLDGKFLPYKKW